MSSCERFDFRSLVRVNAGIWKIWILTPPLKASSLTSVMPDKRGAEHTTAKSPLKASLRNSHELRAEENAATST
jgi:hypothetical protein